MPKGFSTVEAAVEAIAAGRLVIVLDAVERENEGDLIAAAEKVTPQTIHFMISQGRGQVCMPVLSDTADRLKLQTMVAAPNIQMPNFTIPIDHRRAKTGISPVERAATVRAVIDPASRPDDFVRPGHLFPLIAKDRGVLARPGHTEAAVDLARLAGLRPAGVLCEICSSNGLHMAGREELMRLASRFRMPLITIDALIEYRRQRETQSPAPCAIASAG
ncbi:MAG: 3,4-dihydroxy-2-butanone-4-phosphate synthase [Pirellulales bacterium]